MSTGPENIELIYVRGSPWSLRAMWASRQFAPETVEKVKLVGKASPTQVADRITAAEPHEGKGEANGTVSLPVLFYTKDGKEFVIRNGIDIVEFLSTLEAENGSPFAKSFVENKQEIEGISESVTRVMEFGRINATETNFNLGRYIAPGIALLIPFVVSSKTKSTKKKLNAKYKPYAPTKEAAEEILKELNEKAKGKEYIVGDSISYADIALCSALECLFPYYGKGELLFLAIDVDHIKKLVEFDWDIKFPDLWNYRQAFMSKHSDAELLKYAQPPLKRLPKYDASSFLRKE